jgi:hypothetical protein
MVNHINIVIVERLPPSSHVKEPSVTAHDEWSIGDLLHWQNCPSLPIFMLSQKVDIFVDHQGKFTLILPGYNHNTSNVYLQTTTVKNTF